MSIGGSWRRAMLNAGKDQPAAAPLLQISWTTKTKSQTRTAAITLGSPFVALLLVLGNAHFEQAKKMAKSILAALGAGP